ncbi:hypothetical protein QFZ81_004009 [Paenibacillus sp. V4I9]|nr:hypothetical protein [Paenibacillus sp. V4I9]
MNEKNEEIKKILHEEKIARGKKDYYKKLYKNK